MAYYSKSGASFQCRVRPEKPDSENFFERIRYDSGNLPGPEAMQAIRERFRRLRAGVYGVSSGLPTVNAVQSIRLYDITSSAFFMPSFS